jgi:hypothetical protein
LIVAIITKATTATPHWRMMLGAKARYSCTARMSELAREMT